MLRYPFKWECLITELTLPFGCLFAANSTLQCHVQREDRQQRFRGWNSPSALQSISGLLVSIVLKQAEDGKQQNQAHQDQDRHMSAQIREPVQVPPSTFNANTPSLAIFRIPHSVSVLHDGTA